MKKAVDDRSTAALAAALTQAAPWAPDPTWNEGETGWRALAEAGAAKANANDFAGARASCKACHRAWRDRYQHEFRERPVPGEAGATAPNAPAPGASPPTVPTLDILQGGRSSGNSQGLGDPRFGRAGS